MNNPIDELYDTVNTLKKVKADIENIRFTVCGIPSERKEPYEIKDEAVRIVDRHINELLKGAEELE